MKSKTMGRKAVEMTGSSENLSAKKGKKEVRLKKKKERGRHIVKLMGKVTYLSHHLCKVNTVFFPKFDSINET